MEKVLPELKVAQIEVLKVTSEEMTNAQKEDPSLAKCFNKIGKITRKAKGVVKYEYFVKKGLLFRKCVSGSGKRSLQLVLPKKFRMTVLAMAHDGIMSGHQGGKNTVSLVGEEFLWAGMQSDAKRYVRPCDICRRTFPKGNVGRAPLGTMPMIDDPFKRVAIDIVGLIVPSSSSGNRCILTMVDVTTRYPDTVALRNIGTEQVAEALVEMFSRYRIPAEILSDRGSNFTSGLIKEVTRPVTSQ